MQDIRRGHTTSELPIDGDVGRINKVTNANFRCDRLRACLLYTSDAADE